MARLEAASFLQLASHSADLMQVSCTPAGRPAAPDQAAEQCPRQAGRLLRILVPIRKGPCLMPAAGVQSIVGGAAGRLWPGTARGAQPEAGL